MQNHHLEQLYRRRTENNETILTGPYRSVNRISIGIKPIPMIALSEAMIELANM